MYQIWAYYWVENILFLVADDGRIADDGQGLRIVTT